MNPKFLITDSETALKAVALNGMSFQFVLQHLRTEELALLAVGKNAHALKHVPVELRTEAVLFKALESSVYVLPHIPEQAWSAALALRVVEKHGLDLENVPEEFRSEPVARTAVQRNGMALEFVPKHLITQSLVDAAVASCELALQFSPPEFRTIEAVQRAAMQLLGRLITPVRIRPVMDDESLAHMESFEKEMAFNNIFFEINQYFPELNVPWLRHALEEIAPNFAAGLFERRACKRQLKYIGLAWDDEIPQDNDEYFRLGEVYTSLTFNGGSYSISGYGDRLRGCAYFEWLKEC